ncbi:hypothetical protein ACTU6V_05395 [Microbacterium sp. A204]|uniref:hypothetical protein n=1 Tax=Microbacterium sp. A204 TaxID=3457321 RepID=UPI003FD1F1A4
MARISLLVSRDLAVLVQAARTLPREVASQMRSHTRRVVEPAFQEEMRSRAGTRLETRVLLDTARVSVSDSNVTLKSAGIGKVHGTPAAALKTATEFGANPDRMISTRSRKGKPYKRRLGNAFRSRNPRGYVFFPSVQAFIPRAGALWFQTAYRTVAETFEKASR